MSRPASNIRSARMLQHCGQHTLALLPPHIPVPRQQQSYALQCSNMLHHDGHPPPPLPPPPGPSSLRIPCSTLRHALPAACEPPACFTEAAALASGAVSATQQTQHMHPPVLSIPLSSPIICHPPPSIGSSPSHSPCIVPTCSTCATPCHVEHALKLSSTVMLFGGPDATTGVGSTPRQA